MKSLREVKIDHIREALVRCNGNKTRAARLIGTCNRSIRYWVSLYPELKEFRIDRIEYEMKKGEQNVGTE